MLNTIIEYTCTSIFLLVGGYLLYRYVIDRPKNNQAEKVYADYKGILDSKLIPLGFERKNEYADAREKGITYGRNNLKITLRTEHPFAYTVVHASSGKKITLEERNNGLPPEIRNKMKYINEQDKNQLVDTADFGIELSGSEEVKAQFLQTIEKWLTENQ
ncbi:MAG TPA: hypothetical protein VFQ23_12655 [Anaerolineales bacterium]|nr:hypothetical protein [Anaerolineales bacterium]